MTYSDRIKTVDEVLNYLMFPHEVQTVLLPPIHRLHAASSALGNSVHADLLRMDICHRIRLGQDILFDGEDNPTKGYAALLDAAATYLEVGLPILQNQPIHIQNNTDVLSVTAKHYGRLWGSFSREEYFDEALRLLRTRMSRNNVDFAWFKDKRALDCGCGGGRYTVALKKLGFAEVIGIDWSEEGIRVAQTRADQAAMEGVRYKRADVLQLPFSDSEFDFVFSNGVLHHTRDTLHGVRELLRVMKPDGRGWLYLYARPGGLDRLTHYLARLLLKHASHEVCRHYCRALELGGSRAFFLLDSWLTPTAECYTPDEVEGMLGQAGCLRWRRLTRGTDHDLAEQIYRGVPFPSLKFGVGENRFFLEGKRV